MRLTNAERITAANALRDYAYNLRQAEKRLGMTGTRRSEELDTLARKLRPLAKFDRLAAKRTLANTILAATRATAAQAKHEAEGG